MTVSPAPLQNPSQRHLTLSVTSVRWSGDKCDSEVEPGVVHRYLGIYLTTEENSTKPQLGDRMKSLRPFISLNGVSCLQNEVSRISKHVMAKEWRGKKTNTRGWYLFKSSWDQKSADPRIMVTIKTITCTTSNITTRIWHYSPWRALTDI